MLTKDEQQELFNELASVANVNGTAWLTPKQSTSPIAIDFEDFVESCTDRRMRELAIKAIADRYGLTYTTKEDH